MIIGPDFMSMMKCTGTELPSRRIMTYQGTAVLSVPLSSSIGKGVLLYLHKYFVMQHIKWSKMYSCLRGKVCKVLNNSMLKETHYQLARRVEFHDPLYFLVPLIPVHSRPKQTVCSSIALEPLHTYCLLGFRGFLGYFLRELYFLHIYKTKVLWYASQRTYKYTKIWRVHKFLQIICFSWERRQCSVELKALPVACIILRPTAAEC